ncbi:hypothetical protein SDC9_08387 [bioreactor metagenome]|uniref:TM2 domain-containing protein n=1 Tax=bioreactor metagenome TaxID=1076179 RepID=A0A644T8G0_9ZZZZ|nr:hypothetical protein [Methanobrevibacter sp.]MEA4957308.1 hypothetical protein [Methanobrevibacter sp.]
MANAILAAILSFFIPGLGQLYGGQGITKSIIFFIIAVILGILTTTVFSFIGIISLIYAIYAAYDAYKYID